MCGILITDTSYNGCMKHRGIKTYTTSYDRFNFIHEHLPIQSVLGDNPIIETNDYVILFNGELFVDGYNNDLDFIRYIFNTYPLNIAVNIISKEDGFYSFIIYHKNSRTIYAFTDPLGKKQLYHSSIGIGSEIKSVKSDTNILDKSFFARTIKNGYVTDNSTPYLHVKRLLPNTLYVFNLLFTITHQEILYLFKETKTHNLYNLIQKAIDNRLKGHENIGLLLSGGLDSSIIYHHIQNKNVQSYCVSNMDDLSLAKMIDPNVKEIQLEYSEQALEVMEMPLDLGSMYPQYSLFHEVNETVILTGDGADEAFGGYQRMNIYDAQISDVFDEIPFYHNIRLDRMSMYFTKECRSPFLSIPVIEFALSLPYQDRINKTYLRKIYQDKLPKVIIDRDKVPLKTNEIREINPIHYRSQLVQKWIQNYGK